MKRAKELSCSKMNVALKQNSLPVVFGSNLNRREVIRCLNDLFVGWWVGTHRLGKKMRFFRYSIFLPSQPNHIQWPPKKLLRHLITSHLFRLLPNTIGNESHLEKRR